MSNIVAKMVVLGDPGVGKTSIVTRYVEKRVHNIPPTVGASFFTTKVNIKGLAVELQVWDTAGQERFKAIVPLFYRNATAAIIVFDITARRSFDNMKSWVSELKRNSENPIILSIVGNKSDLSDKREVTRDEGLVYANSVGASYTECSACNNQGIDQIFSDVARKLIQISGMVPSYSESDNEENGTMFANATDLNATDTAVTETPSWSIGSIAHGQVINKGCC
ncbi:ras-related protein Rab-31 [Agrilus planipennis]|uniref:Ras-related protein Rab-31 n=1 Tax=Agrilus planipennis TaxID=224129 RepID=A0A7F5R1V6_AGRPL|nr:ras-related protein Rab-31 [Agrilus planipennis]